MKNKILSIILCISLILFTISVSIALPIYFRPFYYMLIKPLNIVEDLNYYSRGTFTRSDVIEAYNDVLNYCVFYTPFKTGKLKWSISGMEHFRDCRALFTLDTIVLLLSIISIITISVIKRKKNVSINSNSYLISGITATGLPLILGALISIDFDKAFEIFHMIFFPGKDNWTFDPNTDQVILIMPESFFMLCAILIGSSLIIISIVLIIIGIKKKNKNKALA